MSIFRTLTEKPWLVDGVISDPSDAQLMSIPTSKFGLRVFIAVATVVFSLTIVTYADRMLAADWRALPEPLVLWLNTALLIMSSVAFQRAWNSAKRGQMDGVKSGMLLAGGFAFAFLIGQFIAWRQMIGLGYFAATNPANAFFFLVTALHAVHLLGGLVAWVRASAKLRRGDALDKVRLSVELCTIYWHFLLIIWLLLFVLLLFT
ncbi:MAG: cytochrome c oxidase subunit 3 [Alphaproteobacteria bacterium]